MKFLARIFFRALFTPLVVALYRVRTIGRGNVPRRGGVLLLGNHVSYIDSFIIYLACPRPVRFVVLETYTKVRSIAWFLRLFGAIPIRPEKAKEAIVRTVEALEAGHVVCLFPEGGLTRLGVTTEFRKGFELIARKADCPVVPVYMDGLFESIFSFERGRYMRKWPNRPTCPLQVAFGPPLAPAEANTDSVRLAVWRCSVEAFSERRELRRPLGLSVVRSLKRHKGAVLFSEYGRGPARHWTRAQILALAVSVARRWMASHPEPGERIGILLPPGPLTAAIHLGLFLAGKVPVNFPFTVAQDETEALARGIASHRIRTVITSRAFMPHLMDFWQGDDGVFIDMKSIVAPSSSLMNLLERVRAFLEPARITAWRLDLKGRAATDEAVGLVPRPGDAPVFLSAADLHREALRVYSANFVRSSDVVFTEDSFARPEGLVLGCWGPLLGHGRAVSRSLSQQTEFEPLERALLEQGVTILSGDPAFYRAIDHPLGVRSLQFGFVFGTVHPVELREREDQLDLPLARAWSHAGRIVTMSRPDPLLDDSIRHQPQRGRDARSVGRLLPGIAGTVENSRLRLQFAPGGSDGGWITGPRGVEIAPDGLVFFKDESRES